LDEIIGPDLAREGLRRLKPISRLAASIMPDPGSDMARVCMLESSNYMRNQLLRDADWAGMAHGIEIRVPLVDVTLLRSVAPAIHALKQHEGKVALARSPSRPLPDEIVTRPKTGFSVPTGAWIQAAMGEGHSTAKRLQSKGLISRAWAPVVLKQSTSSSWKGHLSSKKIGLECSAVVAS
jgi:asparagine synthase (glutamine-hydrolysing)